MFPFDQPAPTAFYLTLYLATFVLHLLPMAYVLAGSAVLLARTIAGKGQIAIRMALKALNMTEETNLTDGLQLEASLFGVCTASEDAKEGTRAFLEKRKPAFKNR